MTSETRRIANVTAYRIAVASVLQAFATVAFGFGMSPRWIVVLIVFVSFYVGDALHDRVNR